MHCYPFDQSSHAFVEAVKEALKCRHECTQTSSFVQKLTEERMDLQTNGYTE